METAPRGRVSTAGVRALYHVVVGAITAGNTAQTAIAAALGRDARAVQHLLRAVEEAGFVQRDGDVLRNRRPIYRLADPIRGFNHVVKRGDLARLEDRRFTEAWADAKPRYATHVLGPYFDHLPREFTFRYTSADTTGAPVARVGAAVVNDPAARSRHELDVVATTRLHNASTMVTAIGDRKPHHAS